MPLTKIPSRTALQDTQFIQVAGPDGSLRGFTYDSQTRTLTSRESRVTSSGFHGLTHIAEDLIPSATSDTPGLLSADDKAKLDALIQTRVGVLGFQGAGFPDDGGWLQGEIILAAGNDYIHLERFGNIIRWTVDAPINLGCGVEACAQIYWVQDDSEPAAIRAPSCGGKLPNLSGYGELKIFLLPESAILNPAAPLTTLNAKGQYPTLIFKRYENGTIPNLAEFDMVLRRRSSNNAEASVGWSFTPGPSLVAECHWFVGENTNGEKLTFSFDATSTPGLLGHLLFSGNSITSAPAVIIDYTSSALQTNQYLCKWWHVANNETIGDAFVATNLWQYMNPDAANRQLVPDRTIGMLDIGTVVNMSFIQIGEVNGTPQRRHYFTQRPLGRTQDSWSESGVVEFGNTLAQRSEDLADSPTAEAVSVSDVKDFEQTVWGASGLDQQLLIDISSEQATVTELTSTHKARVDPDLPGLVVDPEIIDTGAHSALRPVMIWNRAKMNNVLATILVGRPSESNHYPPYDILLGAAIDSNETSLLRIINHGVLENINYTGTSLAATGTGTAPVGGYYVLVKGLPYHLMPAYGALRILSGTDAGAMWEYTNKLLVSGTDDVVALVGYNTFSGDTGCLVENEHQEFTCPCVRLQFTNNALGAIQFQVKVGTLGVGSTYELDIGDAFDPFIRGLDEGYAVGSLYTQASAYSGVGTRPTTSVDGFIVYDGGQVVGSSGSVEYWNELEIMLRDDQIWIWWNGLLIPPDPAATAALPTPTVVNTPYFPLTMTPAAGKFGMRLWPGARVRRVSLRTQSRLFSEFMRGQLELS